MPTSIKTWKEGMTRIYRPNGQVTGVTVLRWLPETELELTAGQAILLRGIGKGKGFAGTIKRYGFKRGPKTHGSHNIRQPGSAGPMYPQRVIKGRRMPGRLGGRTVTTRTVVEAVLNEDHLLLVRGAVPGRRRSEVVVLPA